MDQLPVVLHVALGSQNGRLLAANPGPARALVVESVACPAIRKVRAGYLKAWAQLMEVLVAERRPDRPVPPMAGTAAIGAVVHLPAAAIEEGRGLSSMADRKSVV